MTFTRSQVVALAEHIALTLAGSLLTALLPYLLSPGLTHVTGAEWRGLADHVAASFGIIMLTLVGSPVTRKYGVGSGTATVDVPTVAQVEAVYAGLARDLTAGPAVSPVPAADHLSPAPVAASV